MRRIVSLSVLVLACLWPAIAGAQEASPSPSAGGSPGVESPPDGRRPVIDVIKVDGIIDRPMQAYLLEELAEAERAGHQVAIQLDSPGTLGVDGVALAQRIFDADVPVMVWVGPAGATAEGSATLLVYASSVASVAPGAGFGPVDPSSLDHADRGMSEDALAGIDRWAAARGRSTGLDVGMQAPLLSGSIPAQEAIDLGIVQELRPDEPAPATVVGFLDQVDGRAVPTAAGDVVLDTRVARDESEGQGVVVAFTSLGPLRRVEHSVANPTAIYVLLCLGLAGIAFEITQPGFGFAGVAGVIAVGLAIWGMAAVPPSWLGLAVFLAGDGLLMLDVRLRKLGIASAAGLILFAVGSFLLYPDAAASIAISPWLIGLTVVAAVLYYGFALTVAQQARDRIATTQQGLVGLVGEARNDIEPVGGVVVKGTVWRAQTVGEPIKAGTRVRVRGVEGLVLSVEAEPPFEDDEVPVPPPPGPAAGE